MNYLLDTNTCIYIIKRKPASVLQKLKELHLKEIKGINVYGTRIEYQ